MQDYRVYIIGANGQIKGRIEFWSEDDEKALQHAAQYADGHDIELWQQARKILTIKAGP